MPKADVTKFFSNRPLMADCTLLLLVKRYFLMKADEVRF